MDIYFAADRIYETYTVTTWRQACQISVFNRYQYKRSLKCINESPAKSIQNIYFDTSSGCFLSLFVFLLSKYWWHDTASQQNSKNQDGISWAYDCVTNMNMNSYFSSQANYINLLTISRLKYLNNT
jgi:hypothetical protein